VILVAKDVERGDWYGATAWAADKRLTARYETREW
jgi:hypothetical protein